MSELFDEKLYTEMLIELSVRVLAIEKALISSNVITEKSLAESLVIAMNDIKSKLDSIKELSGDK